MFAIRYVTVLWQAVLMTVSSMLLPLSSVLENESHMTAFLQACMRQHLATCINCEGHFTNFLKEDNISLVTRRVELYIVLAKDVFMQSKDSLWCCSQCN